MPVGKAGGQLQIQVSVMLHRQSVLLRTPLKEGAIPSLNQMPKKALGHSVKEMYAMFLVVIELNWFEIFI